MQIDRNVVAAARQSSSRIDVVREPRKAVAARNDDEFVDIGIPFDNRCGVGLDDVGDVGSRIVPTEGSDERGCENYVSNRAQSNEQYAHYSGSTVASSISITGMSSLMG